MSTYYNNVSLNIATRFRFLIFNFFNFLIFTFKPDQRNKERHVFCCGSVILVVKNGEEIALKTSPFIFHFRHQTRSKHIEFSKVIAWGLHLMMFRTILLGVAWLSVLSYQGDSVLNFSLLLQRYHASPPFPLRSLPTQTLYIVI